MRKLLLIPIAVIFIFVILNQKENNDIRVRIIPNSNSINDLKVKEEVKGLVGEYLKAIYDKDYEVCKKNIESSIDELKIILNKHYNDVDVSFDKHTLYNKTYNDNAIKNENTYTLYIEIGDARGDNWWGTIYPNLLEISSSNEYQYESLFVNLINKIKEEK